MRTLFQTNARAPQGSGSSRGTGLPIVGTSLTVLGFAALLAAIVIATPSPEAGVQAALAQ